jgi:hypothetical protein
MTEFGIVNLVCHDGVHPTYVDLALCRAPTKRRPWLTVPICAELRTAWAQDRVLAEIKHMRDMQSEQWSEL